MFFVRNLNKLKNLKFLTQHENKLTSGNFAITLREIRNLPRNKTEFEVLSKPVATPATNSRNETTIELNKKNCAESMPADNGDVDTDLMLPPVEGEAYLPTFNLAAYVNKSPTLQQFLKLGVDLNLIERRKGLAEFVLRLDFEKNVKPYLLFLQDRGVSPDLFGVLITKNPLVFKVDLDDMHTRINYLEAKKFTPTQVQRILSLNPYWLMFATRRIDRRLGHFQKEFKLSGDDVRFLASKQPRLITYNMEHIRKSTFCIREEMGFNEDELRCLLLSKPRLWMMQSDEVIERFSYAHNEMGLSHDMLLQFPEVLTSREFRLRERHEFLKMLGRAQYNPEKDLYVSPRAVVEGNNFQFVRKVAKSDLETFELFLKTR